MTQAPRDPTPHDPPLPAPPEPPEHIILARPVLLAVVSVCVAAAIFLLKPDTDRVIWERLKARPEIGAARAAFDAASRVPAVTIQPGTYVFTKTEHGRTLTATLSLPAGVRASAKTPFAYRLRLASARRVREETASGQASVQGRVLLLFPARPAWMLNSPVDRTLLTGVTSAGLTFVPSDNPQTTDPEELTPFRRQP